MEVKDAILVAIIGTIICLLLVFKLSQKLYENYKIEITHFLHYTFFYNSNTLLYGSFFLFCFTTSSWYLIDPQNYILMINPILGLTGFLFIRFNKKLYKKFEGNFLFNKYSTNVEYYNFRSESNKKYSQKVYQVIIEKIKSYNWADNINNVEVKEIFIQEINPHWESIISLDLFNEKLYNSESKYTIGKLTYCSFVKNITTILNYIDYLKNDELSEVIHTIFHSKRLLRFNDVEGFNFDLGGIQSVIDEPQKIDLEKEKIKVLYNIGKQIKRNEPRIKLPSGISQIDIYNKIVEKICAENNSKLIEDRNFNKFELTKENIGDIKFFIATNFRNKTKGFTVNNDYSDKKFLSDNSESIIKAFNSIFRSKLPKDKGAFTKKAVALILTNEFSKGEPETIENKL